ncbi:MAG TPA: NlpC/P60 family protein [Geobacteraceae bacterium]|nr:NlpC/P60 family protein [Geobacteraceae bacterium]
MARYILHILLVTGILLQGCAGLAAGVKERDGLSRLGYSIQVGAFAEVKNAERLTAKLQGKGIEAFYFRKETGVYAVRFGDFPSHDAARKTARKLVAEKMIDSYFIAAPQGVSLVKPRPPEVRKGAEKGARPKPSGEMGGIAARTAERFVGIPYRWGGDNVVEGMDCSGFVRAVYNLCGVNIPRTSREQFLVGENVARDDLMDGDLVFFGASADQINHVGIYVGNGRFVHAPRRGDDIKISSIGEAFFSKKFIGAKRYF